MIANNPLEIYSTVIGIGMYDQVFNILSGVGLAYFPLIGIFFNAVKVLMSGDIAHTGDQALGQALSQFMIYIFMMMVFVAPVNSIDITAIDYQNNCADGSLPASYGNTGTTYDNVFSDITFNEYKLPIGLAAVLDIVSGVTNSMIVTLPCKTDVEQVQGTINNASFDSNLQDEIHRFSTECYLPAKNKFNSQKPDQSEYQSILDNYGGNSDLSWMGSYVYQSLYYPSMHPKEPVKSFPYFAYPDPYENTNSGTVENESEGGGYPTCQAWWADENYGIKARIVQSVDSQKPNSVYLSQMSISQMMNAWMQENNFSTKNQLTNNDLIAYTSLKNHLVRLNQGSYISYNHNANYGVSGGITGSLSSIVSQAGQLNQGLGAYVNNAELQHQVPITLSILIAITFTIGPLVLLIGGAQIKVVFSYVFFISSLYMMTFVERFLNYLNASLHDSMSGHLWYQMGSTIYLHNMFSIFYKAGPYIVLMLFSAFGVWAGGSADRSLTTAIESGGGSKMLTNAVKSIGGAIGKFI